jgi:di/tricarboxylate transporter
MGWEAWTTVSVVLLVLGLLAFTRAAPDLIFIGAVTLLITFGVLTPEQAVSGLSNEGVITVGRIEGYAAPRHERALVAGLIFAGMVLAAGMGWLTMLHAAMLAAGFMIICRCCPSAVARASVDWQVLLAIAASFAIGRAMETTGIANAFARTMLEVAGDNPWLALAGVYLLTNLCTELMSNNAAAVLMFPIGLATAATLNVSYMPFAIAIMFAASLGFSTPLGYQTHLMVYGPGGYRFTDFLRMGIPLDLLMGAIAVTLIPLFWPFVPG